MSLTVKKDGRPVEYDEISVRGWGCVVIFVPWLLGIAYLVTLIVTVVAGLL